MNPIFRSFKTFTKMPLLQKIFIILLILVFALIVINNFNNNTFYITEGFDGENVLDQNNFFEIKRDQDIYDDFYSKHYDAIFLNKTKNNFEIGKIIDLEKKNKNTKILDIGCGTGNHVNLLHNKNYEVIGIDQSKHMIKKAKLKYPKCEFINSDFIKNDFDYGSFSHILCLGRTIYEIKNKEQFFETCYSLLSYNGFFILNLSNEKNFKPYITEQKDKNTVYDSSQYGKTPMSMIVKFTKDMEFISNYNNYDNNETFKNKNAPTSNINEKFENFKTHSIRKNELNLYINPIKDIINSIKSSGFTFYKKFSMSQVGYDSDYLYVFKKNN